jgi:hypothetical protein
MTLVGLGGMAATDRYRWWKPPPDTPPSSVSAPWVSRYAPGGVKETRVWSTSSEAIGAGLNFRVPPLSSQPNGPSGSLKNPNTAELSPRVPDSWLLRSPRADQVKHDVSPRSKSEALSPRLPSWVRPQPPRPPPWAAPGPASTSQFLGGGLISPRLGRPIGGWAEPEAQATGDAPAIKTSELILARVHKLDSARRHILRSSTRDPATAYSSLIDSLHSVR